MSRFGVIASGFSAPYAQRSTKQPVATFVRPSGQAAANTVAALAARLNEPWMPDNADRFNLLVNCLSTPETAYSRPECVDAMTFTARHARIYTDPTGTQALVGQPLVAGDPWLPFGVWLQRYWYREAAGYQAIPYLETQTWSLPATADGSPPPGTTPMNPPPAATTTTPATTTTGTTPRPTLTIVQATPDQCAALYQTFAAAQPAGIAPATVMASFRQAHPECADWAGTQLASVTTGQPAAQTTGWSVTKKIVVGGTIVAGVALAYYAAKALSKPTP